MSLDLNYDESQNIDQIEFNFTENKVVAQELGLDRPIANNAKLIVKEQEEVVFSFEGNVTDRFSTGEYILNINSLPFLSAIQSWKYGYNNPFNATLKAINMHHFAEVKWATEEPFCYQNRKEKTEIQAIGIFSFQIADTPRFVHKIASKFKTVNTAIISKEIEQLFLKVLPLLFVDGVFLVNDISLHADKLSSAVLEKIKGELLSWGINITQFKIENVSVKVIDDPEPTLKQHIVTDNSTVDLDYIAKIKASKSNAQTMGSQHDFTNPLGIPQIKPKPIPELSNIYVAINNQQTGPYTSKDLLQLVSSGKLSPSSLVWRKGLSNWINASKLSELDFLWEGNNVPSLPLDI